MMAEVQTRFRELSACSQFVSGKSDSIKLVSFLFFKINIFLEKCATPLMKHNPSTVNPQTLKGNCCER
uniref:Uncharacterized protein n=1 Tax=Neovison vison TaxID=452646 RepID=A0A8C7AS47_NEOVI